MILSKVESKTIIFVWQEMERVMVLTSLKAVA
jgi:hypothetical protein